MKLHKLISSSIVATALLGATFGGVFSLNASAAGPVSNGHYPSDNNKSRDSNGNVSKDFQTSDGTEVNITDGYLNLDSTPQFHFGTNSQAVTQSNDDNSIKGSSLGLQSATGPLKVTDYRASSNDRSGATNWSLSVSVSPFSLTDQQNPNSNTQSSDWGIYFTPSHSSMTSIPSDKSVSGSNNTNLGDVKAQSNDSDKPTVMNGGYGSTTVNYNSDGSTNASNKAYLYVPYNVQPGNYSTTMTWNLSTNINSDLDKST